MKANEQINQWKQEEVKNLVAYVQRIKIQIAEWKAKYGFCEMNTLSAYKSISNQSKELAKLSNENLQIAATKIIDSHFNALQNKVIDKIGNIEEIVSIGNNGFDYRFVGEKGNLQIKVVNAGGHNIQVHHTRWTVSKIK